MDTTLVTEALSAATVLFGIFVTLAMVVTGFFLGRRWLAKAGLDSDAEDAAAMQAISDPAGLGSLQGDDLAEWNMSMGRAPDDDGDDVDDVPAWYVMQETNAYGEAPAEDAPVQEHYLDRMARENPAPFHIPSSADEPDEEEDEEVPF